MAGIAITFDDHGFNVAGLFRKYYRGRKRKAVEKFAARAIAAFGEWPFSDWRFFIIGDKATIYPPTGPGTVYWMCQSHAKWRETLKQQLSAESARKEKQDDPTR